MVLAGLAASLAGIVFWPGSDPEPAPLAVATTPVPASPAAAGGELARWNAGETVIERAADGHFYADVLLEGHVVRMLVDTGASVVALSGADAAAMGLAWDDSEIEKVAQGAAGPVHGVPLELAHMRLGGFEAQQVSAIIVPGLRTSLLGQSFLSRIGQVQIADGAMVLRD